MTDGRRPSVIPRRRSVAAALAVAVIAGAAGWALWYRSTFHLWPGQDIPPRIHWCGRDYDAGPAAPVPLAEVERTLGRPLVVVGDVPPIRSHDILEATADAAPRENPSMAGCPTLIYLRVGADDYLRYELQGSL